MKVVAVLFVANNGTIQHASVPVESGLEDRPERAARISALPPC
jgi:hypothetical protein